MRAARSQSSAIASGRRLSATRAPSAASLRSPSRRRIRRRRARPRGRFAIGVGCEPLLDREGVLAAAHEMQPAVLAAHGDVAAVAGDQDIRPRHAHTPRRWRSAARPPRSSAAACAAAQQDDAGLEQSAARCRTPPCGRPHRENRDPSGDRDHPFDAEIPSAARRRRRNRMASQPVPKARPASPALRPPASPQFPLPPYGVMR